MRGMKSLNKVMLIGNLTHDPEVRATPKGISVADFSLALNRSFSGENGDRREETTYVDVVAWNQSADFVGQYFQRGKKAYVEGRLQLDSWEDKETGQPRSKLRVVADRVEFADSRPQEADGNSAQPPNDSANERTGGRAGNGGGRSGRYGQSPAQPQPRARQHQRTR